MVWLVIGVLLWSSVHLLPSVGRPARTRLIERLGEQPYKGGFSLMLVFAIVLMVIGWRSSAPTLVYLPPAWSSLAGNVLVFVALVLFAVSGLASNVKRVIRHPQLTGVAVWAGAHLLANGDSRSLVLFGGLGLWALVEMVCINRRDGAWVKPDPQPMSGEWKPVGAAVVVFALLFLLHPYIAGVPATPR